MPAAPARPLVPTAIRDGPSWPLAPHRGQRRFGCAQPGLSRRVERGHDLLDVQAHLDAARAALVAKENEYLLAVAKLNYEGGTLLQTLGIE